MIYYFSSIKQMLNIGDVAIDYATIKLLNDNNIEHIFINDYNFKDYQFNENDTILIKGGGWLGLYKEYFFEKVLNLPAKKIILPSSLNFNKDTSYIDNFKNNHFVIFARDEISYYTFRKYFKHSVVLKCPDIVLYLKDYFNSLSKIGSGDVKISRNDLETKYNLNNIKCNYIMTNIIEEKNYKNIDDYKKSVDCYINQLNNYQTVITDTLHITLFSYMLNKNVYCYDNNNGKVFNALNTYKITKVKRCYSDKIIDETSKNENLNFDYSIIVELIKHI